MPTPVAAAADVVSTEAPGYWAEPVIAPSTPREYLLSRSLGTAMQFFASLMLHFLRTVGTSAPLSKVSDYRAVGTAKN